MSKRWKIILTFLLVAIIGCYFFLNKNQKGKIYHIHSNIQENSNYVQSITSITTCCWCNC